MEILILLTMNAFSGFAVGRWVRLHEVAIVLLVTTQSLFLCSISIAYLALPLILISAFFTMAAYSAGYWIKGEAREGN